MNTNNKQ